MAPHDYCWYSALVIAASSCMSHASPKTCTATAAAIGSPIPPAVFTFAISDLVYCNFRPQASLKAYLAAGPGEAPFDITRVPKAAAEPAPASSLPGGKAAAADKAPAAGAGAGVTSPGAVKRKQHDEAAERLAAIPEIAALGKLFR